MQNGRNVSEATVKVSELWQNKEFTTAINWIQNLIRSIIPFFILIIMNFFIIRALRKTRANKKLASRNKITTMLIIVIIFFLLFICPDAIMSFFTGYTEEPARVRAVREITDYLLCVNSAINFFLYIIFNKLFRDAFLDMFCTRCLKKWRRTESRRDDREKEYRKLADGSPRHRSNINGVVDGSRTETTTI